MKETMKTAAEMAASWVLRVDTTENASHSGEGGYGGSTTKTELVAVTPEQVIFEEGSAIGVRAFAHDFLFSAWGESYNQYLDSWESGEMDYTLYSDTYLLPIVYDTKVSPSLAEEASGLLYGAREIMVSLTVGGHMSAVKDQYFRDCKKLTEVVIEEGVTVLGERAFALCPSLARISLPASLETIGKYAFSGCSALQEIKIAENSPYYEVKDGDIYDKRTGACVFNHVNGALPDNYKELETLVLPLGMTEISEELFEKCKSLRRVVIPEGVTRIEKSAFYACESLEEITFPESLEEIEEYAFGCCYALKRVSLPKGVKTLGAYAFSYCKNLTAILLPDAIKTVEEECFSNCERLSTVKLPEGLEKIGESAFYGCKALTTLTLPKGVKEIACQAFRFSGITAMELPEGLSVIGYSAFEGADLASVSLPSTLKEIDSSAFKGCPLITVALPEGMEYLGEGAFEDTSLETVTLPKDLRRIPKSFFAGCNNLEEVLLPEGVASIDERAFYYCARLKTLHLPKSVKSIGSYALFGMYHARSVTVAEENPCFTVRDGCLYSANNRREAIFEPNKDFLALLDKLPSDYEEREALKIPAGTTVVPPYLLSKRSKVRRLLLPKSLVYIDAIAFYGCQTLKEVIFHPESKGVRVYRSAFAYCTALESVSFSKGVQLYDDNTFAYCTALKELSLPEEAELGNYAFYGCTSLTSVTVSEGTKAIPFYAFGKCTALSRVVLPEGVGHLAKGAFMGCTSLEEITLPESLRSIHDYAFENAGLREIRFLGDKHVYIDNYGVFENCPLSEESRREIERVK